MTNWDHTSDVVVVGTGGGGMTAALVAKQAGLDVLMIEKSEYYGGSTALSGEGCGFRTIIFCNGTAWTTRSKRRAPICKAPSGIARRNRCKTRIERAGDGGVSGKQFASPLSTREGRAGDGRTRARLA